LQGDDGAVVDETPGEMTAAGDVNLVKLVAEVAVADVLGPEREGEVKKELDAGEEEGEPKGRTEGRVRWADDG
jgi:hypothetical protein